MRKLIAAIAALIAVPIFSATVAHAETSPTWSTAGDAISGLQAWGYDVALNGGGDYRYLSDSQKAQCTVKDINPTVTGPVAKDAFQVVYVSISCPSHTGSSTDTGSNSTSSDSGSGS